MSTTLDAPALRRAIAEALGWRIENIGGNWSVTHNDAVCFGGKAWRNRAWAERRLLEALPNWPESEGAAYALCLEVLDRLNAQVAYKDWRIEIHSGHVSMGRYVAVKSGLNWEHFSAGGRDALALSALALAALEAEMKR